MITATISIFFFTILIGQALSSAFSGHEDRLTALLREVVARTGNDLVDLNRDYMDIPSHRYFMDDIPGQQDYEEMALSPSLRDREYLAHSSPLLGNIGSYGDGNKGFIRYKPNDSEGKITTDLKTDGVLPAYCNPPNPCPIGYTAEAGCLEEFENTAGFSRDYQAMQECMCDTEHMFQCQDSTHDSEITALARSIQNEGVGVSTLDKIMAQLQDVVPHRMVSKKFHTKKSEIPSYLQGEKLPVAAKKGNVW